MTQVALLPDRAVLAVEGEDARTYLQGLITNDIQKATADHAIFAVLLSPQGKYLFEFFIMEHEGALLLETDKTRLPDLVRRMTMYRLRAKVTFTERPEFAVAAYWDGELSAIDGAISYNDPRLADLGKRLLYKKTSPLAGNSDYEAHRLTLGIPEGGKDLIVDRSILLEYGYDHLHAIDFTKGCYVGQEVTARSKHRAILHKYIHHVIADGTLPPPGTVIVSNGREIGDMRSSNGAIGLAVLRTEDAALGQNLLAGDVPIHVHLPRWIAS